MEEYDFIYDYGEKDINSAVEELRLKGHDVRFVDEKIDDGCSDTDENSYVMMRSYDIDGKWYVKFYYGDVDHIIGYIDVEEN